jgi:microcystin-dependent protein/N-acetylneuraminic acid mutarotase
VLSGPLDLGANAVTWGAETRTNWPTGGGDADLSAWSDYPASNLISRNLPDTWNETIGLPAGRALGAACVYSNQIYAIGGSSGSAKTNVYKFDGTSWAEVAGLPAGREYLGACVYSNRIYAIGGYDDEAFTNVYTFDGTTWAEVAGLPEARYGLGVCTLGDRIYAIGGYDDEAFTNVYTFDGTTWAHAAGLPAARAYLAACVLDDQIYAIGGHVTVNDYTNVYKFDGASWAEVAGLPAKRGYLAACAFNDRVYAIAGRCGAASQTNVYRFDGTSWAEVAGLPAARTGPAACVYSNQIYAIGGYVPIASQTNVWTFDDTAISNSFGVNDSGEFEINIDGVQHFPLSNLVPPGAIMQYIASNAPAGWLLCDGGGCHTNTYASLFAVIGYQFGGSGTNFNLPDMRGRVPVGMGTGTGLTARNLNATGGVETVTLVSNQMPSHTHGFFNYDGTTDWRISATPGGSKTRIAYAVDGYNAAGTWYIGNAGGGQSHENMPPFVVLNFIIKY